MLTHQDQVPKELLQYRESQKDVYFGSMTGLTRQTTRPLHNGWAILPLPRAGGTARAAEAPEEIQNGNAFSVGKPFLDRK